MEVIAIESQAYQELVEQLNRIEQYVLRTAHLLQDVDDELEMTTFDVIDTLGISESTLYRWRKKQLIRYRYLDSGEIRYLFKSLIIAIKRNHLRVSGMSREDLVGRLERYKGNQIINSCRSCSE